MSSSDQHIRKAHATLKSEIVALQKQLGEKQKKADMLAGYLGLTKSKPTATKQKTRKKRKKGGITIEAAVIQAVSSSAKALSTSDIVAALQGLGVSAAKQSVYGTISRLKLNGQLESVAHSGRGDAYTAASGKASLEKSGTKASGKKKSPRKKKAAGAKKKAAGEKA